jgi:hypothetical protein
MIVQRNVNKTIDPRAFDLLIDESFIRQGDLIKAIQDSLQQGIELEGFSNAPTFPTTNVWSWTLNSSKT